MFWAFYHKAIFRPEIFLYKINFGGGGSEPEDSFMKLAAFWRCYNFLLSFNCVYIITVVLD